MNGTNLAANDRVSGVMNRTADILAGPLAVLSNGVLRISGGVRVSNALNNLGMVIVSGGGGLALWNDNAKWWAGAEGP